MARKLGSPYRKNFYNTYTEYRGSIARLNDNAMDQRKPKQVKHMFGKYIVAGLVLGTVFFAAAAHSAFYKWVDKNGQVHYTQTPPPADKMKKSAMSDTVSGTAEDKKLYKTIIGNWIGKRKDDEVLLNFTADGRFEDRTQTGGRTQHNGVGMWKVNGEMIKWEYEQGKGNWDYSRGKTKHYSFVEKATDNSLELREPDGTLTTLRRVGSDVDDNADSLAESRKLKCDKPFGDDVKDGKKWLTLIENDCAERVAELLKNGIDPNAVSDGKTPLTQAIQMKRRSIAKQLIKAGADVNKNRESDGVTPLILAAQLGEYQLVNTLIGAGASIEEQDSDKCTALIAAAKENHGVVVKRLLSMGADVEAKDSGGMTALKHAQERGYHTIVKTIQDYKKLTGIK